MIAKEEVTNVKKIQTGRRPDGQTDRRTDGRRTTSDKKSSLEPSNRVG